ncbi:MAG: glycosyltransferase family 4 protein [Acidobacteriota bacterium]
MKRAIALLGPEPGSGGGVANYLALMRRHCASESSSLPFRFLFLNVGTGRGHVVASLRRQICVLRRLSRLRREENLVAVQVHPSLDCRSLLRDSTAVLWARMLGLTTIIFVRGWDTRFEKRILRGSLTGRTIVALFDRADLLLVLSGRFRGVLMRAGLSGAKIRVSTVMVDPEFLRDLEARVSSRGSHSGDRDAAGPARILFLSRVRRDKGCFQLVAAASDLEEDVEIHIAGEGPDLNELRGLVEHLGMSDRVTFLGHVEGPAKVAAFADADLFVLPTSHGEGFPNVIVEAMAAGLPVMAPAVSAIGEVLDDEDNGFILPDTTVSSVRDGLLRALHSRGSFARIRENNVLKARDQFAVPVVVSGLMAAYRDLLDRTDGHPSGN